MSLGALGAGYAAIGALLAVAAVALGRAAGASRARDVVLLVALWPVWAPLIALAPRAARPPADVEADVLARVLPDATAREVGQRLRDAHRRLAELDAVLARPDFDHAAVAARAAALDARGATAAAATAQRRVRTLVELRALRERVRGELDEVHELLAQLAAQAELARLQPAFAEASGALVRDLVAQIDGLEELFALDAECAPALVRSS